MHLNHLAAALALLVAPGCVGIGPRAIATQRPSYTEILSTTDKEEILANIVRMRYLDTPVFLRVSSVTSSPSLQTGLESEASFGTGGDFDGVTVTPGVVYRDSPTIVYSPLTGREFANQLLVPISAETVFLMLENGFDLRLVAELLFRKINRISNDRSLADADREPFRRVVDDLATLLESGQLRIGTPREGFDPTAPRLVLLVDDEATQSPAGERLFDALGLRRDLTHVDLSFGLAYDDSTIAIETRSLHATLAYLCHEIEVPESNADACWPDSTRATEREPLIRILSASSRPSGADPAIRFQGAWYYLAADDLRSRNTFYLVRLIFSLQAPPPGGSDRVTLTLPVG